MRPLLRLAAVARRRLVLAVGVASATVLAGAGLLGTAAYLISAAALHPVILELTVPIVGVRFFALSRAISRYVERLTAHRAAIDVAASVRRSLVERLVEGGTAIASSMRTGEAVSHLIAGVDEVEQAIVRTLIPPPTVIITGLALTGVLLAVSPPAAAAGSLGLFITASVAVAITRTASKAKDVPLMDARARLAGQGAELWGGLTDLIATNAVESAVTRFALASAAVEKAEARSRLREGAGDAVVSLGMWTTVAATLVVAAPSVAAGVINGTWYAPIALLAMAAFEPVAQIPGAVERLTRAEDAAVLLDRLLDRQPRVDSGTAIPANDGIEFAGEVGHDATTTVTGRLTLRGGESVAVIGPSGAGKTTLVRHLAGMDPSDRGTVAYGGVDLTDIDLAWLRHRVGWVGLDSYVFEGSVADTLRLGAAGARDDQIDEVLTRVGLESLTGEGLGRDVGPDGRNLSGGERRRLIVARALLGGFHDLILDEPTDGLDAALAERIIDLLVASVRGVLVVVTHRYELLDRFDRAIKVADGRIMPAAASR